MRMSIPSRPRWVRNPIDAASDTTGTSFQYLLDTAQRESSLRTDAKAPTSSATGLFQFVEGTWLQTLKEEGPSLGLGQYSAEIAKTASGRYQVADPAMRERILALREEAAKMVADACEEAGRILQAAPQRLRHQL